MKVDYSHPVSKQVYEIRTSGHSFSITRAGKTVFGDGKVVGLSDASIDDEAVVRVAKLWVDAQIE